MALISPIVILSAKEDAHIPFVTKHLSEPPVIVEAQFIAEGQSLIYETTKQGLAAYYEGRRIDDAKGVWLRRVRPSEHLHVPVPEIYQKYAKSSILQHTNALFSVLRKAAWVSNPFAIEHAEYKPYQIAVAKELGFYVPDTLFTSSEAAAKRFVEKHNSVIFKTLAQDFPIDHKKKIVHSLYTTKITSAGKFDYRGLSLAPAIFQQAIDPVRDIRVTIVGDKIFAAAIHNTGLGTSLADIRDWRIGNDHGEVHFEPYELPLDIAEKCRAFVRKMDLMFSAVDLVLDKKGQLWFLESNANGQWAFIEEVIDQQIGKSIAALLEGRGN